MINLLHNVSKFGKTCQKSFLSRTEQSHGIIMSVEVYVVSRHTENQEKNKDMSLEKLVWQNEKGEVFLQRVE